MLHFATIGALMADNNNALALLVEGYILSYRIKIFTLFLLLFFTTKEVLRNAASFLQTYHKSG